MDIGNKIKNLRVQKNLTQEELGERTDLTKGYISQLERNLGSPSMETFFALLEVLGCTPAQFFSEKETNQKIVYAKDERTLFVDEEKGYEMEWLIPESNENEMEPIFLKLQQKGEFKEFSPSVSETFAYVLEGEVCIKIGEKHYFASKGETIYYRATEHHQIKNQADGVSRLILVATNSYL